MYQFKRISHQVRRTSGFSLVELMVVVAIIGLLASVGMMSFSDARSQSRDEIRKSDLKQLQLAVELYKAQTGSYPAAGCGAATSAFAAQTCATYITGLTPDFIAALPVDSQAGGGFQYRSDGNAYKIINTSVESITISDETNEFARCPSVTLCGGSVPANTYAVYSFGAEGW